MYYSSAKNRIQSDQEIGFFLFMANGARYRRFSYSLISYSEYFGVLLLCAFVATQPHPILLCIISYTTWYSLSFRTAGLWCSYIQTIHLRILFQEKESLGGESRVTFEKKSIVRLFCCSPRDGDLLLHRSSSSTLELLPRATTPTYRTESLKVRLYARYTVSTYIVTYAWLYQKRHASISPLLRLEEQGRLYCSRSLYIHTHHHPIL